jgi:hypothetical protein
MKPLEPDEKTALVMLYMNNSLVRGEIIVKISQRVNIWLRTQSGPNFIHIHRPQIISFGGASPRTSSFSEMFLPTTQVLGFHLIPPSDEPLDYETTETNRMMQPIDVLIGTFLLKGKIRMSTQTDIATSLDVTRATWLSVYDADITNPNLLQFNMHVPMLLVNSIQVTFGLV